MFLNDAYRQKEIKMQGRHYELKSDDVMARTQVSVSGSLAVNGVSSGVIMPA